MKKFKFSLQTPLDVVKSEEKDIKSRLGAARALLRSLEFELSGLENRIKSISKKFSEDIKQDMSAGDVLNYHNHLHRLNHEAGNYKIRINDEREKCEIILQSLIEVKKRIKMLEILKENKYTSYLKEVEREESKQLEDFLNGRAVNI